MTELLAVQGVGRGYGGFRAVDGVDLSLAPGARHALVGPNGAGKSTLLGLIAGTVRPDSGRIVLDGRDITRTGPARRSRLGIGRSFQQPAVAHTLSALDNVLLAAWRNPGPGRGLLPGRRRRGLTPAVRELLAALGLAGTAERAAGELSHGQRRLLDLACALAGNPRILLLDEPAAGLADDDLPHLLAVLRALPAEVAVLLVEHDFALVAEFADTVTVLQGGRLLARGTPGRIAADPAVRDAHLGTGGVLW